MVAGDDNQVLGKEGRREGGKERGREGERTV
jgi:hypothetical protein